MVYVPPKYPSEIPSAEDLPDRQDDVHWLYAARYNELKKELRAALIELGVLPKGEHADVRARLDAAVGGFHDRGDPSYYDFDKTDLTTDGAWHDLDLSAIVPEYARAVSLHVEIMHDTVNRAFSFKKKGNYYGWAIAGIRTQAANVYVCGDLTVACDATRVIEYFGVGIVFTHIYITVKGWWG